MNYKSIWLSPLGLVPLAAGAADMPVPVRTRPVPVVAYAPSWAGFYVGVHAGVISDQSKQSAYRPLELAGQDTYCWVGDCTFTNKHTATGFLGGAQVGYNFQAANFVFGMEADFSWSSAKKTSTGSLNGYDWTSKSGIDGFGTVRLRVGYAFDRVLVYGTGGLAYANQKNTHQVDSAYTWSTKVGWHLGWTAGGGVEVLVAPNWTLRGEGLYYDLGRRDHLSFDFGNNPPGVYGLSDKSSGVIGRVGLNYLFR